MSDVAGHGVTVAPALLAVNDALETLLLGFGGGGSPVVTFPDLNTFWMNCFASLAFFSTGLLALTLSVSLFCELPNPLVGPADELLSEV